MPALVLAMILCLCLLPVMALAADFPNNNFYASITFSSSSNAESFGTVKQSGTKLIYTKTGVQTDHVIYGMESAGGAFFTVEGTRGKGVSQDGNYILSDDGWRELRLYNSDLTNYRVIGEVTNQSGTANYAIVDTAIDLSGEEPALYGTYNQTFGNNSFSFICSIDLTDGHASNWLQVSGDLPSTDIIYAIAFDKDGTLYAIGADGAADGGEASLYTIELGKNNATATKVGSITDSYDEPISTNFCQDLAFNYATDVLYWMENKDGILYTLDTETAKADRAGQVYYNDKSYGLQSFCIPYDTAINNKHMISVIYSGGGKVTNGDEDNAFYMVDKNGSLTLALTPDKNGKLLSLKVDGKSVSVDNLTEYTLSNVTENHVIDATFRENLPVTQKNMTWFHYQGYEASFYTQHQYYKFYDLPSLDKEVPRDGYTQTLLDKNGREIPDDERIIAGNYDVHVTHPGTDKYNALDEIYEDALQLEKCPGTPGRPVVYGKVGCTQGDLITTSSLQDWYNNNGELIGANIPDEIPVTLEWQNPEKVYTEPGYVYDSATIHAAENLNQRILDCYNLDDGVTPLTGGCQISHRSSQVVVLPADEASLIKLQASDDSGGTVSGKGVYKNGDTVTVTATVNTNAGYTFKGWQENGQIVSGADETYTFTASGDRTLTAMFEAKEDYRVTLQTDPQDGGIVTGGGNYDDGNHNATVTATANNGYYFIGWYKAGQTEAVSTDAEYTFEVPQEGIVLTAKFGVDLLARAEQAKDNLESSLGTSVFEWTTLTQAVDAYEKAKEFVESPPSGVTDPQTRFDALTAYYNGVEELDFSNLDINNDNLAELYLFTGVTQLNLSGNKDVTSLTNLAQMTKLETLDLSNTVITDLSGLSSPTKLKTLNLSNNTAITDLNCLSSLTNLKTLDLSGDKGITDLSGLSSLVWLETLDISGTGVTAFDALINDNDKLVLSNLGTLTANNLSLTSLSALAKFVSEDYMYCYLTAKLWDFTGSTLPDTEENKTDVETIQTALGDNKFIPPTIPTTPPATYNITVVNTEHGKVTASPSSASQGDLVTITVTPAEGYELEQLTVTADKGDNPTTTDMGNGKYTFTMPDANVDIKAVFRKITLTWENCPGGAECPLNAFSDVNPAAWYHDGVHFCLDNGMMIGYGEGIFGPSNDLSRAMLVQILYNYEGHPAVSGDSAFTDVAKTSWYFDAVTWAAAQGIVDGYGNGKFGPNDPITREQLATILWRYIDRPAINHNLDRFTDAGQISGWAMDAMEWACGNGIMEGDAGALNPKGNATRAEAATMLMRFVEKYGK